MAAIYVDSMDDWLRVRATLEPVYITSKKHGRVLVPCANTILVRTELVVGNLYNPNAVSPDRLELLETSILETGFCFAVLAIWDDDQQRFVVVDGFHRRLISGTDWLDFDYIPVAPLSLTIAERMAATWRLNKAKGVHQVSLDAELIRALLGQGVAEEEIVTQLGIDLDTVHRYKQVTGVAELFKNAEWSRAWEMKEEPT